ncbi:MAG: hypothetical protein RIC84_08705 [Aggregatilineales bacterium]
MKYDSLDWHQSRALEAEYDKRHADKMPEKPEFEVPHESVRATVETDHSTDVYVRMNANSRRDSEATAEMRVVGSQEHLRVAFKDTLSIRKLIAQLERLADDMDNYNQDLRLYLARQKQYEAEKEAYTQKREKDLREALKSGKYTAEQIELSREDIPF